MWGELIRDFFKTGRKGGRKQRREEVRREGEVEEGSREEGSTVGAPSVVSQVWSELGASHFCLLLLSFQNTALWGPLSFTSFFPPVPKCLKSILGEPLKLCRTWGTLI